jgi:hypothetical protein
MLRNSSSAWILLSFVIWLAGGIWKHFNPDSAVAFLLYFFGWICTLLVVGFFSTPSNSVYGKIAFGSVGLTVAGIVLKVLHLPGGNETIVVGLLGIGATYAVMWLNKRDNKSNSRG